MESQLINLGRHVQGELHSSDASAGVVVPIYDILDSLAAYTLAANEYLAVESISIVTAAGGDVSLFFDDDDDQAAGNGETIFRGTLAANATVERRWTGPKFRQGTVGGVLTIIAPAGAVDVQVNAFVRRTPGT